jgi:hypothetical protein
MLGKTSWRRNLAAMNLLVARYANGEAVGNVRDAFWVGCDWLNVVRVQLAVAAALLALVAVAAEYGGAPLGKITTSGGAFTMQAMAALPCSSLFANARTTSTGAGAKLASVAGKCFSAPFTNTVGRWPAATPARLAAILRRGGTVCLDLVGCSANRALLFLSRVPHVNTLHDSRRNATDYCAVILERMQAAFPEIKIERA